MDRLRSFTSIMIVVCHLPSQPFARIPNFLCEESSNQGYECFEGPFAATGVTDVLTQCQAWDTKPDFLVNSERKSCYSLKDGRFEWNFCKNRKSLDGRPFAVAELQNGRIRKRSVLCHCMTNGFRVSDAFVLRSVAAFCF